MASPSPATSNHPKSPTPFYSSLLKANWKKKLIQSSSSSATAAKTPFSNLKSPSSNTTAGKTPFSSLPRTVVLTDWWLIKSEDVSSAPRLAIAGKSSNGPAIRYFSSGAIAKRHDNLTLETVDGFTITLTGLINRWQTLENGFSSEVCSQFFLGFPFEWEELWTQCFGQKSSRGALPAKTTSSSGIKMSDDDSRSSLSISVDDLPVTRVRDHLMLSTGDCKECILTRSIFDHILKNCGGNPVELSEENNGQLMAKNSLQNETGPSLQSNEEKDNPIAGENCSFDETIRDQSKSKVEQRYKAENDISEATLMQTEEFQIIQSQSTSDIDVNRLCIYRSKKISRTSRKIQEERISLNTCTKPDSTSEATGLQDGYTTAETNAPNGGQSAIISKESVAVDNSLDGSVLKKSRGPKQLGDGVSRRRQTRLTKSSNNHKENLSSTTFNPGITDTYSASEVTGDQCRGMDIDTCASNVCLVDKLSQSQETMEVEALNNPASRKPHISRCFSSGILTRSKAKLKRPRHDPEDSFKEVDLAVDNSAVRRSENTADHDASRSLINEREEISGTPCKSVARRYWLRNPKQ